MLFINPVHYNYKTIQKIESLHINNTGTQKKKNGRNF